MLQLFAGVAGKGTDSSSVRLGGADEVVERRMVRRWSRTEWWLMVGGERFFG